MKYVYIYLDPRKPGNYAYGTYVFTHEPMYVGIGNGYRHRAHLHRATNKYLRAKLQHIRAEGVEPVVLKVAEGLSKSDAIALEKSLIAIIGRLDRGPLVNFTDGGEGCSRPGIPWTPLQREKIMAKRAVRQPRTGMTNSPEMRMKQSLSHRGKSFSAHHRERLAAAKRKPVVEISASNEVIATYSSAKELMQVLQASNALTKYIRTGKPFKGRRFVYASTR